MPTPTKGDVHVDRVLTNISIAYTQSADKFIATDVFANIPSDDKSGRYFTYDKGDWLREEAKERGLSSESAGGGFSVDNTPTFNATVYALHKDVDDQLRANQTSPLDLNRDATEYVTHNLLMLRDRLWRDGYFQAGVWDNDKTGVTSGPTGDQFLRWDESGSAPIDDLDGFIDTIEGNTGFLANVLVLGRQVWTVLKNHDDFTERIKYTQGPAIVSPSLLAQVLELDRVLIARSVINSAAEGAADSVGYTFGKHAALYYAQPRPSILMPSAGYTFSWTGYLAAGNQGNRISNIRNDLAKSDRIEGEMAFDQKVVSTDLGLFAEDAVS